MPSITTVFTFLTLALFATFTLASLDEHSSNNAVASLDEHASGLDVATVSASAIYARYMGDDVTNGFMNWYKIERDPYAKPVVSIAWTNQTCQNVPSTDNHWASLQSVSLAPGEGYHARCWAYIGPDCRGQQSKEFNEKGISTSELFGNQFKAYYSFHCTCDQECIIVSNGARARSVGVDLSTTFVAMRGMRA